MGFLVVCGPDGTSLHEAGFLLEHPADKLHLDGVLVNECVLDGLSLPYWMA